MLAILNFSEVKRLANNAKIRYSKFLLVRYSICKTILTLSLQTSAHFKLYKPSGYFAYHKLVETL